MANQPKNLGLLHEDKTGLLKHREWRGLKDTMYDYYRFDDKGSVELSLDGKLSRGSCVDRPSYGGYARNTPSYSTSSF